MLMLLVSAAAAAAAFCWYRIENIRALVFCSYMCGLFDVCVRVLVVPA